MAVLISSATGNFTASSTWSLVDSTSYNGNVVSSEILTTAYSGTRSSAFTPGAITIDGIAVKVASRAASPTGTISVNLELDSDNSQVAGTEVTLNVSDLPLCTTADIAGGWIFFKFSSPVTLLAATAYQVAAKTSSASQVNLYRDGTADNILRMLRTTTNQAPAAADILHVIGEHTGTGTGNNLTVTMDNTTTTDFGAGTADVEAMSVGKRGTLTWGTSASTNYYLKLSGDLRICSGGTYNMGTTGTPMPSTSTGVLEFDPAADGDNGFRILNGSTVSIQGNAITTTSTLLTTDEAIASTVLGVASTSGWAANDEICIASTSRTHSESEKRTISTVDSATQVTISAGLTNAHTGTAPKQAEVINLTRNLKVRSATSTIMAYVYIDDSATVDIDYCQFYYLGENATQQRGIEINTATGSCSIQYSSLYDVEDGGVYITNSASNNITFSNNVLWNINNVAASGANSISISGNTGASSLVFSNNIIMQGKAATNNAVCLLSYQKITFSGNTFCGCDAASSSTGYIVSTSFNEAISGEISGTTIHSSRGIGLRIFSAVKGKISTTTIWYCLGHGIAINANCKISFETGTLFGNDDAANLGNILIGTAALSGFVRFLNYSVNSDATNSSARGINIPSNTPAIDIYLMYCDFGSTSAHSSADISIAAAAYAGTIFVNNTILASSTEVSLSASSTDYGCVKITNKDRGSTHISYYRNGTIASDTTTRHTASGLSWKLTPSSATDKLVFPGRFITDTLKVAVVANSLVTINAYLYKDSSYNGSEPRLVLLGGMVAGINTDVTDTMTVAHSNWEQLTVTGTPTADGVLEFYIDCDGTAGNVYVDDISVSQ